MTYLQRLVNIGEGDAIDNPRPPDRHPLILVIEDGDHTTSALQPICDFLDVLIERIPSQHDLRKALHDHRPMGVVAHMDCQGQDGCHVMMTVAERDPSLPILLITGDDPTMAGAAEAVQELWKLTAVVTTSSIPSLGVVVDFLFRAGRSGQCMRLIPV